MIENIDFSDYQAIIQFMTPCEAEFALSSSQKVTINDVIIVTKPFFDKKNFIKKEAMIVVKNLKVDT
jgi:hypothetical protein